MGIPPRILELLASKGTQMTKFVLVTLVNISINQIVLYIANTQFGLSGGWASLVAALIGTGPAYFLSRRWVWEKTGPHSLKGEVAPFLAIALLGLVVSGALAEIAGRAFGAGLAVNAGNLLGYFVVWVIKFVLLDRLFASADATEETHPTNEPVTAT